MPLIETRPIFVPSDKGRLPVLLVIIYLPNDPRLQRLPQNIWGKLSSAGRLAAELVRAAGAQFTTAPTLDPAVVAAGRLNNSLHLPSISTLAEAQQAAATGYHLVKVDVSPERLAEFHKALPGLAFIATGEYHACKYCRLCPG
jgi:hypothetical protein